MSTYHSDDDIPFDVTDEIEVDDLSDQEGNDVIEPASRVGFVIKKAELRIAKDKENDNWFVKRLSLQVAIGPLGTDGEGKNANRRVFPEFILAFNAADYPDKFSKPWWEKQSRFPTKALFSALDIPLKGTKINDDFLVSLQGREFVADITKKAKEERVDGKYVKTGEFDNELKNFRPSGVEVE
jgi:hypothetical protein